MEETRDFTGTANSRVGVQLQIFSQHLMSGRETEGRKIKGHKLWSKCPPCHLFIQLILSLS